VTERAAQAEFDFMESLLIKGGVPLCVGISISGAKNAVLPIMAATLLTSEPCHSRVPDLSDVIHGPNTHVAGSGVFRRHRAGACAEDQSAGDYDLSVPGQNGPFHCNAGPLRA
jgi:hypothetical protein